MRKGRAFFPALAVAASAVALGHAHLEQSVPADGSVVSRAPTQLVLRFSEPAQLTALAIEKEHGARQKLPAPAGKPQAQIVVPLPTLAPGSYVVSWRAVAADGHVVPGQVHFTLSQ
ncbi:MAG TPA: copper resistance CopC family protein [Steroidobacteraceae bacterium]|nr:copper resistance CopC family protein [Steroidobacteraceae bacterium]